MPLGKSTEYPQEYAPGVLFAVARAVAREPLGLGRERPFHGADICNAWELSWLDDSGKPVVATATLRIDAGSPNIVESKSLKLYLGSFALSRYASAAELERIISVDIGNVAGSTVDVSIATRPGDDDAIIHALPGACVDDLGIAEVAAGLDPALLRRSGAEIVSEELHTHLLRSLCPVTGQPDYGSVLLRYQGPCIDPQGFLEYIVSFRRHSDFHEVCVERMFMDIRERCSPEKLTVYARYTRRGGIDINPFRSDFEEPAENLRLWRQ